MLKKIIKRVLYSNRYNSSAYIKHLRRIGVTIGEDCIIYSPTNSVIDEQYPWMISIGNHVRITQGVILLTHDYSWSVLKLMRTGSKCGEILGASGKISIGNNVFIGMNTIVLRNVNIGDNVIIGAGSVVSKNCESNWVYAGNPAKKIMEINDFSIKRRKSQLREAKELAICYKERYGIIPDKEVFHEYFMLFTEMKDMNECFSSKMELCGNLEDSIAFVNDTPPMFKTYEEFIKYCFNE